jgi:hypothetical protein
MNQPHGAHPQKLSCKTLPALKTDSFTLLHGLGLIAITPIDFIWVVTIYAVMGHAPMANSCLFEANEQHSAQMEIDEFIIKVLMIYSLHNLTSRRE